MLDCHWVCSYVHASQLFLGPIDQRKVYEQACFLVLQFGLEYHHRSDDICNPHASLEATTIAKETKNRPDVRFRLWCLVRPPVP